MPQSEITGHLRVYRTGTRVDVISHYTNFGKQKGGGKRGDITGGFSAQSRKRLYELLNSIDEDALRRCLFVTLTYRREHVEPKECKKNLKAFIQSMRRFDATTSGIWKLEFQDRGSPHYHVIVFRRYIPHGWVAATWNRIAEDGDPVHLKAGTEVRAVQKRDSCYAYIGKYMAKLESGGSLKIGVDTGEYLTELTFLYQKLKSLNSEVENREALLEKGHLESVAMMAIESTSLLYSQGAITNLNK